MNIVSVIEKRPFIFVASIAVLGIIAVVLSAVFLFEQPEPAGGRFGQNTLFTGPVGEDGLEGFAGPLGFGPRGPTGSTGPTGRDVGISHTGPSGITGDIGPTGDFSTGATGWAGLQGKNGVTGPTGQDGPTGDSGFSTFSIGTMELFAGITSLGTPAPCYVSFGTTITEFGPGPAGIAFGGTVTIGPTVGVIGTEILTIVINPTIPQQIVSWPSTVLFAYRSLATNDRMAVGVASTTTASVIDLYLNRYDSLPPDLMTASDIMDSGTVQNSQVSIVGYYPTTV